LDCLDLIGLDKLISRKIAGLESVSLGQLLAVKGGLSHRASGWIGKKKKGNKNKRQNIPTTQRQKQHN
jgi:hypothetical protein